MLEVKLYYGVFKNDKYFIVHQNHSNQGLRFH